MAQVFRTRIDPFVQKLSFVRIHSGHLKRDEQVHASTSRKNIMEHKQSNASPLVAPARITFDHDMAVVLGGNAPGWRDTHMAQLLDKAVYAPTIGRFKVYIIDEVHMLSRNAFNAMLKTLEEPPPHVKFLFATTEIRKVPVTILSRTQRFDLRRVEPDVLVRNLEMICENEGARVEAITPGRAPGGGHRQVASGVESRLLSDRGHRPDPAAR